MDKELLKKQIIEVLTGFFQEERGNRLTTNNLDGLGMKIIRVIDNIPVQKEKSKK